MNEDLKASAEEAEAENSESLESADSEHVEARGRIRTILVHYRLRVNRHSALIQSILVLTGFGLPV